jgi:hypothetical protein
MKRIRNIPTKNKNVFHCDYCPQSFSRRGAFRNHLRSHRDQIYLDENELTRNIGATNIGATTETTPTAFGNIFQRTILSPILINDIVNPLEENNRICVENQSYIEQVM